MADIIIEFVLDGFTDRRYWEVEVLPEGRIEVFFENGRSDIWASYGDMMQYLRSKATIIEIF